jgi:hypothetical protein
LIECRAIAYNVLTLPGFPAFQGWIEDYNFHDRETKRYYREFHVGKIFYAKDFQVSDR